MNTVGLFGYGSFGRLVADQLAADFTIKVYDSRLIKAAISSRATQVSLEQAAGCDIVIMAVPLGSLESLLKQISPHLQPTALVVDVTSVKLEPVRLMKALLPPTVEILATHPLFGPQTAAADPIGQTIIISPVRLKRLDLIEGYLRSRGLKVVMMTPKRHDQHMALIQGLTFFAARGLKELAVRPLEVISPSYQKLVELAELDRHHSQELFDTIEGGNPYARIVRQRFIEALREIDDQINDSVASIDTMS